MYASEGLLEADLLNVWIEYRNAYLIHLVEKNNFNEEENNKATEHFHNYGVGIEEVNDHFWFLFRFKKKKKRKK